MRARDNDNNGPGGRERGGFRRGRRIKRLDGLRNNVSSFRRCVEQNVRATSFQNSLALFADVFPLLFFFSRRPSPIFPPAASAPAVSSNFNFAIG